MRFYLAFLLFLLTTLAFAQAPTETLDAEAAFYQAYDQERFLSVEAANNLTLYQSYLSDCLAPCAYRSQAEAALFTLVKGINTSVAYAEFLLLCPTTCSLNSEAKNLYQQRLKAEKTDLALFARAETENNVLAYRAYLNVCSLCLKREAAELALTGLQEQAQWQSLAASKNSQDFQNYLNTCRACTFRQQAEESIRSLKPTNTVKIAANGLLQVRQNADSAWGLVCDDGFGKAAAGVIARQLGFAACAWSSTGSDSFVGSELPIFLDDLACRGDEAALTDCQHRGWGNHNCNKGEAVFLRCS